MAKSEWGRLRGEWGAAGLVVLALVCATAVMTTAGGVRRTSDGSSGRGRSAGGSGWSRRAQGASRRVDINLRSFTPHAAGQLTIEPDADGGRAHLTALNLPDPQTLARAARTYVVWAASEGRFVRLGELRRDERGNGGLAFARPAAFERYTVMVTAETAAEPEKPTGAPVLSTRANEAQAMYAQTGDEGDNAAAGAAAPSTTRRGRRENARRPPPSSGDFYAEVDDALDAHGGGRALLLEGDTLSPQARGQARVTAQTGNGYVRVRFRGVPLPSRVGASTYVLWAVVPDGRIVYMGSLPATREINFADIYVRTAGFDADDFELFVTAEMRRPLSAPSNRRALSTQSIKSTIK